jgi:hypothetical protein
MDRWLTEHSGSTTSWKIICTDFFTYSPEEKYDVIFDYTYVLCPQLFKSGYL